MSRIVAVFFFSRDTVSFYSMIGSLRDERPKKSKSITFKVIYLLNWNYIHYDYIQPDMKLLIIFSIYIDNENS